MSHPPPDANELESLARLWESGHYALVEVDQEGRVQLAHPRVAQLLGVEHEGICGQAWFEWGLPSERSHLEGLWKRALGEGAPLQTRFEVLGARWLTIELVPTHTGHYVGTLTGSAGTGSPGTGSAGSGSADEERDAHRGLVRLIDALGRAAPTEDVLHVLLAECERTLGLRCVFFRLDDDGGHLRPLAAPTLPASFFQVVQALPVGPGIASCGVAVHERRRVVTEDTSTDADWAAFQAVTSEFDIGACWSEPIYGPSQKILGTLASFSREPGAPQAWQTAFLSAAAGLLALAYERDRLAHEQREAGRRAGLRALTSRVAHDFNNLLAIVIGNAGLLLREAPAGTFRHQGLARITTAAEEAARLTRELLALAGRASGEPSGGAAGRVATPTFEEPGDASGSVLLVDDEAPVRDVVRRILEHAGYSVVEAANGDQALELFRQLASKLDVVLLDHTMPGMNGDEVFREMRALDPAAQIVLSSGYTEEDVATELAERGLAAFLQKPYPATILLSTLRDVLAAKAPGRS